LGLEHKSVDELLTKLARLTEQTKSTFTEKDIAVFQHVNSIEITTRNAQAEVKESTEENKAVVAAIGDLMRQDRPQAPGFV
jgi:hypothetical protein